MTNHPTTNNFIVLEKITRIWSMHMLSKMMGFPAIRITIQVIHVPLRTYFHRKDTIENFQRVGCALPQYTSYIRCRHPWICAAFSSCGLLFCRLGSNRHKRQGTGQSVAKYCLGKQPREKCSKHD
jgi:hypothetical protein